MNDIELQPGPHMQVMRVDSGTARVLDGRSRKRGLMSRVASRVPMTQRGTALEIARIAHRAITERRIDAEAGDQITNADRPPHKDHHALSFLLSFKDTYRDQYRADNHTARRHDDFGRGLILADVLGLIEPEQALRIILSGHEAAHAVVDSDGIETDPGVKPLALEGVALLPSEVRHSVFSAVDGMPDEAILEAHEVISTLGANFNQSRSPYNAHKLIGRNVVGPAAMDALMELQQDLAATRAVLPKRPRVL